MPLPLIVGVVGAVSAAVGGAGTGVSMWKMRGDKKRYKAARESYEQHAEAYRDFVGRVKDEIDELHNQRVAAQETLREAADFLERANVRERDFDPGEKVIPWNFAEFKDVIERLRGLAAGLAGGAAGGAALGAAAAAGTYAAVGAFGTASTGTVISGLSGIAARNATLAWLGGGSLAAGGGGMAAGAASLASIGLAPLAIIPAIVSVRKALKQGKRIDCEIEELDVSRAKMDEHRAELAVILSRVREVSKALREVGTALKDILSLASAEVVEDLYRVASAAKALAQLLDIDGTSRPDSDAAPDADGLSAAPVPAITRLDRHGCVT